jgi:non-canonical purine NTP pyrophosphatase (RdgB/HAM1 family)
MTLPEDLWTKTYPGQASCHAAQAHHQWVSELVAITGDPVQTPRLHASGPAHLTFDYVLGRHARPEDLSTLAGLLGRLHRTAHETSLWAARLDTPFDTGTLVLPDFISSRRGHVQAILSTSQVPGAIPAARAAAVIDGCADAPAAFYKDSNLRNILITGQLATLVDFDCLTLAPFGYDLAKLLVSLVMTHGLVSPSAIARALAAYNTAITGPPRHLPAVTWRQLMDWAEIHHILTSVYNGRHGYRHSWHQLRPASTLPGADDYYLGIAGAVSRRGDCIHSQVGAVIVSAADAIIAADANRTPGGRKSCLDGDCPRCLDLDIPAGNGYTGCIETHAEGNVIANAGTGCQNGTIYLTRTPCAACLALIRQSGLRHAIWPGGQWHRSPSSQAGRPGELEIAMATSNPAKLLTAREHLHPFGVTVSALRIEAEEIQSQSLEAIAEHKARQALAVAATPVIVEDSGFYINELGGFPGPFAKYAAKALGAAGIARLADLTRSRTAHFESALVYADATGTRTFTSTGSTGTIALEPSAVSTPADAWSPLWDVFIPAGADRPLSVLTREEREHVSSAWRTQSVFTQLGNWLANAPGVP